MNALTSSRRSILRLPCRKSSEPLRSRMMRRGRGDWTYCERISLQGWYDGVGCSIGGSSEGGVFLNCSSIWNRASSSSSN
jgi:hypothetical protein